MFSRDGIPLMSSDEFKEALHWINDHFVLIRHADMADEPSAVVAAAVVLASHKREAGCGDNEGGPGASGETALDEEEEDLVAQEIEEARQPCTIDWVLARATQAVYRWVVAMCVGDAGQRMRLLSLSAGTIIVMCPLVKLEDITEHHFKTRLMCDFSQPPCVQTAPVR